MDSLADRGARDSSGVDARPPLFELDHATVSFGGTIALGDVSLRLVTGEHVAILGPNGSGKSTLLRLLTGDVRSVWREGPPAARLFGMDRWDLFELRERIGVVSDTVREWCDRPVSVRDTVLSGFFGSVGLRRNHVVTTQMQDRADELVAFVGMDRLATRRMNTLSTGEARRTLIARALVHGPEALVLDEPFSGLDPAGRHEVHEAVMRVARQGTTLLLVTHDVADISPEITRLVLLRNGRVAFDGPKSEALTAARLSELYGFPVTLTEHEGHYHLR